MPVHSKYCRASQQHESGHEPDPNREKSSNLPEQRQSPQSPDKQRCLREGKPHRETEILDREDRSVISDAPPEKKKKK